jgi:hypothetical protein
MGVDGLVSTVQIRLSLDKRFVYRLWLCCSCGHPVMPSAVFWHGFFPCRLTVQLYATYSMCSGLF